MERAHVGPHRPEVASSPGRLHMNAGPVVDVINTVHPGPSDALAREFSGREDRGTQAELPSRGHDGGITVRWGDIIMVAGDGTG